MPADDLFPGYSSRHLTLPLGGRIFARESPHDGNLPSKPLLLLLHGYPQTHVEWHRVAPALAAHFALILLDLPGYGGSAAGPALDGAHPDAARGGSCAAASKRSMAAACVAAVRALGHQGPFSVMGHDRGARVAYRMAFDAPEAVRRVVVLDIMPTSWMFSAAGFGDAALAVRSYHWGFLAQPAPFPETLIGGVDGGRFFLEHSLRSWTAAKDLGVFGDQAMQAYREAFCREETIHATCEDLRAGAWVDRVHDEEDLAAGRKITVPLRAVWGEKGLFAEVIKRRGTTPVDEWRRYAEDVSGCGVPCGHFVTEEAPEATIEATLTWLREM